MLYELVATYFGVENNADLQTAVDNSGVSILDVMADDGSITELPDHAIPQLVDALNQQTEVMIRREIESGRAVSVEELLMAMNYFQEPQSMRHPNRKARRKAKAKNKG